MHVINNSKMSAGVRGLFYYINSQGRILNYSCVLEITYKFKKEKFIKSSKKTHVLLVFKISWLVVL